MKLKYSGTVAGIALVAAAVVFFVSEGVSAALYPDYSYVTNFISDLGVPTHEVFQGKPVYSPGAWALNTGWVINSALVLVALIFSRDRRFAPTRTSRWLAVLAIGYSIGLVLCSVFHESPDWMQPFHLIGAVLGIAGGNVALLLAGAVIKQRKGPKAISRFLVISGIVGLSFTVMSPILEIGMSGVTERAAAYPVLLAQLVGGVLLIAHSRRSAPSESAPSGRVLTP